MRSNAARCERKTCQGNCCFNERMPRSINIRSAVNGSTGDECGGIYGNIAWLCNSLRTGDAMEVYSSKTRLVNALNLKHLD